MGTEITVRDKDGLAALVETDVFKKALRAVLPKHVTPERMIKQAFIAASRQPKLFECTQGIMKGAELGLDVSGTLGSAYLVPFYNSKLGAREAVFIPGYRGLIDLAHRTGEVDTITARVVHKNDKFKINLGTSDEIIHEPCLEGTPGPMVCVYGIAWMKGANKPLTEVMTLAQVDAIRKRSKAKDSGPWVTDYEEMARKTVVKRMVKYLPLSPEKARNLEVAVDLDNQAVGYADIDLSMPEPPLEEPEEKKGRGDALAGELKKHAGSEPPPNEQEMKETIWEIAMATCNGNPEQAGEWLGRFMPEGTHDQTLAALSLAQLETVHKLVVATLYFDFPFQWGGACCPFSRSPYGGIKKNGAL